jgi:hypothetical protein
MVFCSELASWEVQLSVLNILVFVSLVVFVSNFYMLSLHRNLQNNSISGGIPATIGQLTQLTSLFLYANNFTGQIPASIGNLSSLVLL